MPTKTVAPSSRSSTTSVTVPDRSANRSISWNPNARQIQSAAAAASA